MKLDELSEDIIAILPYYLDSLDDLYSLIQTSRTLYNACSSSDAKLRPHFAKRDGQRLFPPHPHLLVAGTARKLADWAVRSHSNRDALRAAIKGGIEGVFDLAVSLPFTGMSLADARALTNSKYEVLNPLTRIVDLEAGPANRAVEYAKQGITFVGDGEWWTILEYPELALLYHWIYCELFHHTVTGAYDPGSPELQDHVAPLGWEVRSEFLSFCVPDCNNKIMDVPQEIHDQANAYANSPWKGKLACLMLIQQHLYRDTVFNANDVRKLLQAGGPGDGKGDGDKEASPAVTDRDRLFHNVVLHQGITSMRFVLPGGVEATKGEVEEIRTKLYGNDPAVLMLPKKDEDEDDGDAEDGDAGEKDEEYWESMDHDCGRLIWGL